MTKIPKVNCPKRTFVSRVYGIKTKEGQLSFPSFESLRTYVDQFSRTFPSVDMSDSKVFCFDVFEIKNPFKSVKK